MGFLADTATGLVDSLGFAVVQERSDKPQIPAAERCLVVDQQPGDGLLAEAASDAILSAFTVKPSSPANELMRGKAPPSCRRPRRGGAAC